MRTLKDKLNNLNPRRREKVEARAAQLIAGQMTRRELHCAKPDSLELVATSGRSRKASQIRCPSPLSNSASG